MSIFINKDTKLVVQGITGRDGSFHAKQMIEYGTQVVAGVTPGKGGQKFENTVPIFNTVADAVKETGANTSVIYVPPAFANPGAALDVDIRGTRAAARGRAPRRLVHRCGERLQGLECAAARERNRDLVGRLPRRRRRRPG